MELPVQVDKLGLQILFVLIISTSVTNLLQLRYTLLLHGFIDLEYEIALLKV